MTRWQSLVFGALAFAGALFVYGCARQDPASPSTTNRSDTTRAAQTAAAPGSDPAAPPDASFTPLLVNGSGQTTTAAFALRAGLAVIRVSHDGRAGIVVNVADELGEFSALAAKAVGPYDGARAVMVPHAGNYMLNIQGEDAWTARIEQPVADGSELETPIGFTGCGQQVTPLFRLTSGVVHFTSEHTGTSNFIAKLYTARGDLYALAANQVGSGQASNPITIKAAGNFLLDVLADGDWSMMLTRDNQLADAMMWRDAGSCAAAAAGTEARTRAAALATSIPYPTFPPALARSTPVPIAAPVPKNQPARVSGWSMSYVGELRDKILYLNGISKTASGVWVTIELRVKNLQPNADNVGRTIGFRAVDQNNRTYAPNSAAASSARWEYCGCSTASYEVGAGAETVIVVTFDVPAKTRALTILPIEVGSGATPIGNVRWMIEKVDRIPAFKPR